MMHVRPMFKHCLLHHDLHWRSGQAILLVAVSAIGLIAMMGLAIDGGRLLLLRRDVQNAADAAAIAATRALCTGDSAQSSGLVVANRNGYDNPGLNTVDGNRVTINNPPLSGNGTGNPEFVEVIIEAEIPPSFIAIVYDGPLITTARAVGRCWEDTVEGATDVEFVEAAVYATCSIDFGGSQDPYVSGGGLYSGSKCSDSAAPCGAAGITITGQDKRIYGGTIALRPGNINNSGQNPCFKVNSGESCKGNPQPGLVSSAPPASFPLQVAWENWAEDSIDGPYDSDADWGCSGCYHYITGDWSAGCPTAGVYVVDGNVRFGNQECGKGHYLNITIVASGYIHNTGADNWVEPYDAATSGILFYAFGNYDTLGRPAVLFSKGQDPKSKGLIGAPNGMLHNGGQDIEHTGAFYGECVDLNGQDPNITYDGAFIPQPPPSTVPVIGLAE